MKKIVAIDIPYKCPHRSCRNSSFFCFHIKRDDDVMGCPMPFHFPDNCPLADAPEEKP